MSLVSQLAITPHARAMHSAIRNEKATSNKGARWPRVLNRLMVSPVIAAAKMSPAESEIARPICHAPMPGLSLRAQNQTAAHVSPSRARGVSKSGKRVTP